MGARHLVALRLDQFNAPIFANVEPVDFLRDIAAAGFVFDQQSLYPVPLAGVGHPFDEPPLFLLPLLEIDLRFPWIGRYHLAV